MCPKNFKDTLEAPCLFHGGQTKHLLKDCATIRGYICGTLDQEGKAQKLALNVGRPADAASEDNTKFPEANCCLMIFGGS